MATLKAEMNLDFRRGSELNTGSHGLPKMTMEDFKLLVVLGKGSFGKVCHTSMIHACTCTCFDDNLLIHVLYMYMSVIHVHVHVCVHLFHVQFLNFSNILNAMFTF